MNLFEVKRKKATSVVDFINMVFEDHKLRMVNHHRNWALQLAWVRGHQNVDYNKTSKQWTNIATNPWQSRLISNLMLPTVRNNVSRLLNINAKWEVLPATPDEEDIQIANTSTKIARDIWSRTRMDRNLVRVLFWQATTGNGFLKIGWDAEVGEEIEIRKDGLAKETIDQFMEVFGLVEDSETIKVREGELFIEPVSPFNITVEPSSSVFDESPYVIESQLRPLDWVVSKFGNRWKELLTESDEHKLFNYPYVYNELEVKTKKGIIIHELFVEKGHPNFPNGLYSMMSSDRLIITPQDLPYDHGKKPFVHFSEIYDPASMWGTCVAEQIRPNQARYNDLQSRITDNIRQCANLQWLNPKQSSVTSFTNRPGAVIDYRHPFLPTQTDPKPLPGQVSEQLERTRRDMQDTSSQHDVSIGKNEAGVRATSSILALQEADDNVNGPTITLYLDSLTEVGKLALGTTAQFIGQEKTLSIIGDFNEQELVTFSGSELIGKNTGDYFNVRVQAAPISTMSRAARVELITSLIQLGVLNPETQSTMILGALGLGDSFTVLDGYAADRSRQWREIQRIIAGEQVNPIQNENHEVHINMIKKFISSGKRDQLTPEIIAKINEHKDGHDQLQALELAKKQLYLASALSEVQNATTDPNIEKPGDSRRTGGNGQRSSGGNRGGTSLRSR